MKFKYQAVVMAISLAGLSACGGSSSGSSNSGGDSSAMKPTRAVTGLEFRDTDLDFNEVSGTLNWQASASDLATEYLVYLGEDDSSPTGDALATITKGQATQFLIPENTVLTNISHVLVYSQNSVGRFDQPAALQIVDNALPQHAELTGLSFVDKDGDMGEISGSINWQGEADSNTEAYALFWHKSDVDTFIADVESEQHNYEFPADTELKEFSTVRIYSKNAFGLSSTYSSLSLIDMSRPTSLAQTAWFPDQDISAGKVKGQLIWDAAIDESIIDAYQVYWGSSETTKLIDLADQPVLIMAASGQKRYYSDADVIPAETEIPAGATHFLIHSKNTLGESLSAKALKIVDYTAVAQPAYQPIELSENKVAVTSQNKDFPFNFYLQRQTAASQEPDAAYEPVLLEQLQGASADNHFLGFVDGGAAFLNLGKAEDTPSDIEIFSEVIGEAPYRRWVFEHTFNPEGEAVNLVKFQVHYSETYNSIEIHTETLMGMDDWGDSEYASQQLMFPSMGADSNHALFVAGREIGASIPGRLDIAQDGVRFMPIKPMAPLEQGPGALINFVRKESGLTTFYWQASNDESKINGYRIFPADAQGNMLGSKATIIDSSGAEIYSGNFSIADIPAEASHIAINTFNIVGGSAQPLLITKQDLAPVFVDSNPLPGFITGSLKWPTLNDSEITAYNIYFGWADNDNEYLHETINIDSANRPEYLTLDLIAADIEERGYPGEGYYYEDILIHPVKDGVVNENSMTFAKVNDMDYSTTSVTFSDDNVATGVLSGTITIDPIQNEGIIESYQLVWGSDASTDLGEAAIKTFSAEYSTEPNFRYSHVFSDEIIPSGAEYLLLKVFINENDTVTELPVIAMTLNDKQASVVMYTATDFIHRPGEFDPATICNAASIDAPEGMAELASLSGTFAFLSNQENGSNINLKDKLPEQFRGRPVIGPNGKVIVKKWSDLWSDNGSKSEKYVNYPWSSGVVNSSKKGIWLGSNPAGEYSNTCSNWTEASSQLSGGMYNLTNGGVGGILCSNSFFVACIAY